MSEALIFLGGAAFGAIIVTAITVRWSALVFLRRAMNDDLDYRQQLIRRDLDGVGSL